MRSTCAPPEKVITSFDQKFTTVNNLEWSKENENEWEAAFKMDGTIYSANFSNEGKWIETAHEIKKEEIPVNVFQVLQESYGTFEIPGKEMP